LFDRAVRGHADWNARCRRLLAGDPGPWRQGAVHRADGVRAIKRADPDGEFLKQYDTSALKHLFLAGERADPDTIIWAQDKLGVPVIDHWWQTETGWSICANPVGIEPLPVKLGSPSVPMPGYVVDILAEDGTMRAANELGAIAVKLPLPPSCLPTIWGADAAFIEKYLTTFPGYYETGDAGYKDEDGYLYIMARTDDVINVAGHRLSTGQLEEVLAEHPDVAECAVIGVADELKGQLPLGLICLYPNCDKPVEQVCAESIDLGEDAGWPGVGLQSCCRHRPAAENPLRQGASRHDGENRRWRRMEHAGDNRRPGDSR
jgi:propionyl-CoA synthetase